MDVYAGTSGYGYKEWKGKFYPETIKAGEMLRFYARRFRTVEVNNTFYRMPKREVLASWAGQVPPDFVFAVKAPQVITHIRRLTNVRSETDHFFGTVSALESRLGPILFQFPASFRADHALLRTFLGLIPAHTRCAFEFRSASWLDGATADLLGERGFCLCIADTDQAPVHDVASTADWGYLRLRRSDYRDADLAAWVKRILDQRWKTAYVFFKHEEEAKGAELAMRFHELARAAAAEEA